MLNAILLSLSMMLNLDGAKTTYNADVDQSKVLWKATKVVGGGHNGTIKLSEGFLELDGTELSGGSFTVDMTSIANSDVEGEWKAKLEGHLKSDDFFAVETYKTATLKVTNAKSTGNGKYDVSANITIKGKTEAITFPAEISVNGSNVSATAKITLDRTKFDVRYGSTSFFDDLGDKAISDEFTIEITLAATK